MLRPIAMLAMAWLTLSASALANSLGAPQAIEPGAFTPVGSPRSAVDFTSQQPHPAVARIVVPEGDATSYGSGTLVDVRDQYGLVVTNWHVVRDGNGEVEVIFPDGFRSKARPLKVDADWDLAALVIWRPNAAPVKLAATAPQAGEQLTICGYGSGNYRAATGRCTQYYAPAENLPQHMVELDVEARQGDSGGPIFNSRGELAGVLFGAGQGTTLGSFGGRVEHFLASLAPNIGTGTQGAAAIAHAEPPQSQLEADNINRGASAMLVGMHSPSRGADASAMKHSHSSEAESAFSFAATTSHGDWQAVDEHSAAGATLPAATNATMMHVADGGAVRGGGFSWFESTKNLLALVGIAAIVVQSLRLIR
ncbi:S1 family peptidase [Lacipirellula parvula]|uniref:S1 family peptidase n=1 Tax=Lacipirellula parvula TaxID=2650471 RepID=UPI0015626DD2|nr:serine protease [Lacipirellula parvula]